MNAVFRLWPQEFVPQLTWYAKFDQSMGILPGEDSSVAKTLD